jgi:hypothetical protein
MWSHYSDGHKGFCVGYRRAESNVLGSSRYCLPVDYEVSPRTLKLSQLLGLQSVHDEIYRACILTKDKNWEYEKEWRLLFKEKDQLVKLEAPIQSITFGERMPKIRREAIRRILAHNPNIEYFETKLSSNSYDVNVVRLD